VIEPSEVRFIKMDAPNCDEKITLRDRFAIAALQGLMARDSTLAPMAYECADAALKQRNRK